MKKITDTERLDHILDHAQATGAQVAFQHQFVITLWTKKRFPGRRDIDAMVRSSRRRKSKGAK